MLGFTPVDRARINASGPDGTEPLSVQRRAAPDKDAPKQNLEQFLASASRPTVN
jgi:hypothetical protein